jgi:DNA-binding transcriptional regulator GbsR (MarR family)
LAEVVAFEEQVVDFFVSAADLLGVPKSVAAIYGIVFASPRPLNFAEIEERLNISKGSVSQGLRVLREVGALKEVSTDTDKAELFEPDLEMRRLIDRFLENRLQKQLESGSRRLALLKEKLGAYRHGEQVTMRGRVKKLQQWQDRSKALLPVMRTFLKLGG